MKTNIIKITIIYIMIASIANMKKSSNIKYKLLFINYNRIL